MNFYGINNNTIALITLDKYRTKILEYNKTFIVYSKTQKIIKHSCIYFGSTYEGRKISSKIITGYSYKLPIVINNNIFFPTSSPRSNNCCWFSLKHIKKYIKKNNGTLIIFKNKKIIYLKMSFSSFDKQFLKAIKLNMLMKVRK